MAADYVNRGMERQEAFEQLLKRYRGMLFSICRRFSRRGVEVEDLVQDAVLMLWKQRERLMASPPGPQQAVWVWRVAHNAAVDTLRSSKPTEELPEGVDTPAEDRSLVNALYEQIAMLDEPDRTLVTLQLQGYSYAEIAVRLGMTEKNVSVRLVRVKEKLRKEMNP